jgi:hypothetical protein
VYQKVNGEWVEKQLITGSSLGLRRAGGLGITLAFMDQNTMIITAPFDYVTNFDSPPD